MSTGLVTNLVTNDLEEYLIRMRRHFHQHPELSLHEAKTEKKICEELDKMGIPWICVGVHNVIGVLEGVPGEKKLCIRGDIDALPIQEETGLPFRSVNDGVMHACGHDTHTAMTLAAAKYLAAHHENMKGTIYFVFQGAEEVGEHGSEDVVPYLKEQGITMALGMHTWEQMESGTICVEEGPRAAGIISFDITVKGRGSHGSRPDLGVDPIRPACNIIEALSSIPSNMHYSQDPLVVNIARFKAGTTANNIVPETANFGGTVRYFKSGSEARLIPLMRNMAETIAAAYGAEVEFGINPQCGPVYNSAQAAEISKRAVSQIEGLTLNHHDADMGSDDFCLYTSEFGGMYAHLGTGNGQPGQYPQHHPKYDVDEAALKYGTEFYIRFAKEYLGF